MAIEQLTPQLEKAAAAAGSLPARPLPIGDREERQLWQRVTGRTHRLWLDYRGTEEILTWSIGPLSPVTVDDPGEETAALVARVRDWIFGVSPCWA
ncbi:hypothetical protein [Streptomyces sp. NPDC050388]|uniref:hypothetical protein n=1 Tax=Streptomyces sp. NPDC050388 TaxID=3155781 RepID=UPI0034413F43